MKKLLKKQGFTLVELIVVIAIMAIMLAMLIPSLSTGRSFEQEARENARAFYSNVQELMIDEKLSGTKLNDDTHTQNSPYTLIYAVVTTPNTTTLAETDVSVVYGADRAGIKSGTVMRVNDDDHPITRLQEFAGSLNKLLRSSGNPGYYYAVVDDKYRVVYTYYSRYVDFDMLKSAATLDRDYQVKTTKDGSTENNYIGAYPFSLNSVGKDVLPEPNDVAVHA